MKYFPLLFLFSIFQGIAQENTDYFCLKIKADPFFEEEPFKKELMPPCMGNYLSVLSQNWECLEDSTIDWNLDYDCRFSNSDSTPLPVFTETCSINCPPNFFTPEEELGKKFPITQVEPEEEKIPEEITEQVIVPAKPPPKKVHKKVTKKVHKAPKKIAAAKPTRKKRHKAHKAPKKVVVVTPAPKKSQPQRKIASEEYRPVSKKKISTYSTPSDMNFLIFSLSYINSQYQKSSVEALDFDWNPTFYFQNNWAARGQLGYHVQKINYKNPGGDVVNTETFPIIPLAGYINYISDWFLISGGGGAQYWLEPENQKIYGFASAGLAYFFTQKTWLLERVFLNYNQVFFTDDPIHEYVAGVSFKF